MSEETNTNEQTQQPVSFSDLTIDQKLEVIFQAEMENRQALDILEKMIFNATQNTAQSAPTRTIVSPYANN